MPETSVVIRAFNEAEHVGDVLEAVDGQQYDDFEILLVDSGSTDGTLEIAEEYVDGVEFVAPRNFTFGYSCNVGCVAASGDFVAFLSAHAIPTDDRWLGTMVENLRDDEVAMTYSNQVGAETTQFSERRLFDELFPEQRRRQTPPDYWANNASSAIKRDLWEDHQFDESLTGHEDIEWAKHFMDQGYVVVYEPDACIYHIHDETWEQVFNRFEREAIADVEIGVRSPSDRWREYLAIPRDIIGDAVAAASEGTIGGETLEEIVRFRYNQHMGTVSGLLSERDLERDRYEYYYDGVNESVFFDAEGNVSLERSPLPNVKPNDVLVRTEYVGVGPEREQPPGTGAYPIVPSGNYVGTVIELGVNANSVEVGDVVVGGTRFHCGVCDACAGEAHRNCENPTHLGVDTDYGAYSRFVSVPSGYVYPLPDGTDPRKGVLLRSVMLVREELGRVDTATTGRTDCVVVGDTPKARLAAQVIESLDGYSATRTSETALNGDAGTAAFGQYDIVVETTGRPEVARRSIRSAPAGATIVLLGDQYGEFGLTNRDVFEKTVLKPRTDRVLNLSDGLESLADIETDAVLDGTYELSEFETAWDAARADGSFPVIRLRSDE
jgi:glycosyltransferase involved in cell wall biosynthesis/threonine dehydrogenase-like Zn-dependent dehydrogenase